MNLIKLFARLQFQPITDTERRQIAALSKVADQFEAQLRECEPGAAKLEIKRLRAEYNADPTNKTAFTKLEAAEIGQATLEQHYINVRSTVRTARGKWFQESVAPFILPILTRAADTLDTFAKQKHDAEAADHAEFEIPFHASTIAAAIKQRAADLRGRAVALRKRGENDAWNYAGHPLQLVRGLDAEIDAALASKAPVQVKAQPPVATEPVADPGVEAERAAERAKADADAKARAAEHAAHMAKTPAERTAETSRALQELKARRRQAAPAGQPTPVAA